MDIPPPPPAIVTEHQNPSATPGWAKDAVWYQVFVERFRNGDSANDPRAEDFGGEHTPDWRVSPWGMEWYARDVWEKPKEHDFFATVFDRRFGGDLIGLREQLPYLQNLGITAIYLNPIFHAASLHKYDAASYHHIDPAFGPDRLGDLQAMAAANETEDPSTWVWTSADRYFLDLVADIHARGMRIIIDGVFNHSGQGCFAFQDLKKNGKTSKYADWYQITGWNDDGTFAFASWDGGGFLPNFGRGDGNLNPGLKKYLFDITRRWMDPSGRGNPAEGIDGWRLDVATCIPHQFWREWHAHVRSINPAAYSTAEIVEPAHDWIKPDEFDAVMNYEWTYPTISFFTPHSDALTATEFQDRLNALYRRHDWDSILLLQNLFDSHDTGRVLTMFESRSPVFAEFYPFFSWAKAADNRTLITSKPGKEARESLRLAVVWQMTGPGAPMIYYGTEVGMWGANDPCNRQPMLWSDIPADPETRGFRDTLETVNERAPDLALFAFYQRLIALRTSEPALRRGLFTWLHSPSESAVVFERAHDGTVVWCAINKGFDPVEMELAGPGYDIWHDQEISAGRVVVPASSFRLIRMSRR